MSTAINLDLLIKRFAEQLDTYQNPNYHETQTRIDFINPFSMALGWDVNNEQGLSINYQLSITSLINWANLSASDSLKKEATCISLMLLFVLVQVPYLEI